MFQKGDYISYGGHGVCRIADIRKMNFGNGGQLFFVIEPITPGGATIYLPVEHPKTPTRMRPVLTKEEIDSLIQSVKNHEMPWIQDRKNRTAQFQQILARRDTRELLLLASCLHQRKTEKGLPASELEILHKVEGLIEQEFSFALKISRDSIGSYIQDRL